METDVDTEKCVSLWMFILKSICLGVAPDTVLEAPGMSHVVRRQYPGHCSRNILASRSSSLPGLQLSDVR
jgi:hypothetical protein